VLRETDALLCTAENDQLDWVGFGCPHFSPEEFTELAVCIQGRKVHSDITATIFTSRKILRWADDTGVMQKLVVVGFQVYSDGCLSLYPQSLKPSGSMMTNSAKAANYIYSQSGYLAVFGSIREGVESAVAGKIIRRPLTWRSS